jgi:Ca-activated chloride channel family protein
MQRLWVSGRLLPAGARLAVQHVFRSDEDQPLEVIYGFPLPRDAALRGFRITGDNFEAHSELRQTEEAVKAYEQGVADGSLSALARQYGDGVVNLTVGNIRPHETVKLYLDLLVGVELRDNGFRFRFPFTLAPAYHSKMRAAAVAGKGELELPGDEFGDMILPPIHKDATLLHEVGFDLEVLHQLPVEEIGSPSHSIRVKQNGDAPAHVSLATEKDVPNRDLVLDVSFQQNAPQVLAGPTAGGKRHFAAVVPSVLFGTNASAPRRTAIVLDRSGSMEGAPLAQARKAIEACLASLSPEDQFGLVAFDDRIETMDSTLQPGSREQRERARTFLNRVDARGGTELADGILAAARILNGSGDLLILTDGQVAGTERILQQARAANLRLFSLGIGSASQDRFLSLLARETGGISRFVTARERVDLAAVDLFASMGRPVASQLKASANVQPEAAGQVFAGTPVLLFGEIEDTPGSGIELTWDGGRLDLPIPAGDAATGETVRLLQGSRLITDWEIRYPADEALAPLEKRKQSRVGARLRDLSAAYGLASREMSLVAVVKRSGDRPGELPETRVVPVGMPQDTRFDAYFSAPAGGAVQSAAFLPSLLMPAAPPPPPSPAQRPSIVCSAQPAAPPRGDRPAFSRIPGLFKRARQAATRPLQGPSAKSGSSEDALMDLAAQLEPDGGMPGDTPSARAGRTIAAVLAFVAAGHTPAEGAFRSHVGRLVAFLQSMAGVSTREKALIERALQSVAAGIAPPANWQKLASSPAPSWKDLEKALR